MIFPVRCISCGKVIGQFWEAYCQRMAKGEDSKKILDSMSIERFCCRGMFLSHVDLVKRVGSFQK